MIATNHFEEYENIRKRGERDGNGDEMMLKMKMK